jgi:hypothetical protein
MIYREKATTIYDLPAYIEMLSTPPKACFSGLAAATFNPESDSRVSLLDRGYHNLKQEKNEVRR